MKLWMTAALLALAACTVTNTPQANQDEAGLRAAAKDARVLRFYEAREWRTAWTDEQRAALESAIGGAEQHGLDPDMFAPRIANGADPAARDAAFSLAALGYAEALARGRADPARLRDVYEIPRPNPDLAAGLNRALDGGDLAEWFGGLAPQDEEYRLLSAAYTETRQQIAAAQGRASAGLSDRARTLAVNLERRRWLEREPPATRIDVDTGAAVLSYYRDNQLANRRAVVVGQAGTETPSLASPMTRLVANPTWTVPRSIQQREIAPKGAAYMARNNMEMRDGQIVQGSGPRNSLGLVKFDMENTHAIYLHDTPAKGLFGSDERHRSHGCVRVSDALGFARMLAEHAGILDQWERARRRDDDEEEEYEQAFVPLPTPIPVRLLYHTARVEDGRVIIVEDAYGWDDAVAQALGLPASPRRAARARLEDIGP